MSKSCFFKFSDVRAQFVLSDQDGVLVRHLSFQDLQPCRIELFSQI